MIATGTREDRNIQSIVKCSIIECNAQELENIIRFLKYAKAEFESERAYWSEQDMNGDYLQLHYRDWYAEWSKEESDFSIYLREDNDEGTSVYSFADVDEAFSQMSDEAKRQYWREKNDDELRDVAKRQIQDGQIT